MAWGTGGIVTFPERGINDNTSVSWEGWNSIMLFTPEGEWVATEGDGDNEDTLGALMALLTQVVTLLTFTVVVVTLDTVVVVTLDTVVVEGVVVGVLDMLKMIQQNDIITDTT